RSCGVRPGVRHFIETKGWIGDQRRGASADCVALALIGQVFDGRLAVDASQEQSGEKRSRARLELDLILPVGRSIISVRKRPKRRKERAAIRSLSGAFEKQVIEAERK